ncbi:phage baseplate assembly protein W [Bradyrhizobium diazoefficiens]
MASVASSKSFLGVGWNFPLAVTATGQAAMAAYEEDVRQAILIILQTNNGERLMRPTFGAGLNSFVFEPINPTSMAALQTRVQNALIDWEPRIDVVAVSVTPASNAIGTLLIDITYRVRLTNSVANLVYPFYLGEGSSR